MKTTVVPLMIITSVVQGFSPVVPSKSSFVSSSNSMLEAISLDDLEKSRNEIAYQNMPISSLVDEQRQENGNEMGESESGIAIEMAIGRIAMVSWIIMVAVEATTGKSLPEQVLGVMGIGN